MEQQGALSVTASCTHPLLSGDALERIRSSRCGRSWSATRCRSAARPSATRSRCWTCRPCWRTPSSASTWRRPSAPSSSERDGRLDRPPPPCFIKRSFSTGPFGRPRPSGRPVSEANRMALIQLTVYPRETTGKNANRRTRARGAFRRSCTGPGNRRPPWSSTRSSSPAPLASAAAPATSSP